MNWLLAEELGNPFTHYDAFVLLVTKYKAPKFWFVSMEKKCVFLREIVVGAGGLEPPTNGLKGRCSTIELHSQPLRREIRRPRSVAIKAA